MALQTARVGLVHGEDRRRNIFRSLDLVRDDVIPKLRGQVMLKPNFLSSKNQLAASHADIALAITGFAGHGGPDDEPGLVHFACARQGRATAHRERHFGDIGRGPTRIECMRVALEMIAAAIATRGD